jgi:hypothetical protein
LETVGCFWTIHGTRKTQISTVIIEKSGPGKRTENGKKKDIKKYSIFLMTLFFGRSRGPLFSISRLRSAFWLVQKVLKKPAGLQKTRTKIGKTARQSNFLDRFGASCLGVSWFRLTFFVIVQGKPRDSLEI